MAERIKVAIRVRPFNAREAQEAGGTEKAFDIRGKDTLVIKQAKETSEPKSLGYDHVFASDPMGPCYTTPATMFEAIGKPLVENALNAYNGCAFFYGQTGAGKSHSCLGDPKSEEQKGILPRCCEHLFQMLENEKTEHDQAFTYVVLATYLEIYNEKLSDLLADNNSKDLQVRLHPELGPHVPGLTESPVNSYSDMNELLDFGAKNRIVAATAMNAQSSRSHAIFSVDIRINRLGVDAQSRVHFVDLAGSERQKKTAAEGERLKEGIAINQSLTVLGKVISALTSRQKGVVPPFRESKLTLLLKECLSGNSRTVLVACVSPSAFNAEETLSTLEFASRCKLIATSSKKNEVDRRDQIEALEAEKALMESQLKKEQELKAKVLAMVDEEKARAAQLELEMAELRSQIATSSRVGAEHEQQQLIIERDMARAELEQAQQNLAQAEGHEREAKEKALETLEREMAEKEAIRREREAALEQVTRAERAREQILADQESAQRELQEQRNKLASAAEMEAEVRREMEAKVALLETEQEDKRRLAHDREEVLKTLIEEKAAKEDILRERMEEAEARRREREELAAEQAEAREEVERARRQRLEDQREREEELRRVKEAQAAKEQEMQQRLEELKNVKEESLFQKEKMYETALKTKTAEVEAKVREMQDTKADLESRIKSLQADKEELRRKAQEQREQRLKLAGGAAGISPQERAHCPRIVNLHRDPFLSRRLVFYLPAQPEGTSIEGGGVMLGSDRRCQIQLEGLGITDKMCVLRNEANRHLFISPVAQTALVKVGGAALKEEGQELKDGDRLAIGECGAYLFEVEIPDVRASQTRASLTRAEDDFALAMKELDEGEEIESQWKETLESASYLIKHKADFGTKIASAFLNEAKQAAIKVKKVNTMLKELPDECRRDIKSYDLAVLFDSRGLPMISVVAHRDSADAAEAGAETGAETVDHGTLRDGSDIISVWTMPQFEERLHLMQREWEEWQERRWYASEEAPCQDVQSEWQPFVWGGDPLIPYSTAVESLRSRDQEIEKLELDYFEVKKELEQHRHRNQEDFLSARNSQYSQSSCEDKDGHTWGAFLGLGWLRKTFCRPTEETIPQIPLEPPPTSPQPPKNSSSRAKPEPRPRQAVLLSPPGTKGRADPSAAHAKPAHPKPKGSPKVAHSAAKAPGGSGSPAPPDRPGKRAQTIDSQAMRKAGSARPTQVPQARPSMRPSASGAGYPGSKAAAPKKALTSSNMDSGGSSRLQRLETFMAVQEEESYSFQEVRAPSGQTE